MRTKKLDKKLSLKKVTVSRLADTELHRINAGEPEQRALRTRYTGCNNELAGNDLLLTELTLCALC